MIKAVPVSGSFRDPAGHVFEHEGRIFRSVTRYGRASFETVLAAGFLDELVQTGALVPFERVEDAALLDLFPEAELLFEHPKLTYVSYPYEWSFFQLRDAALLQLDIAIKALDAGVVLSDATAYNIQFIGSRPVFIDHLSFQPYRDGAYWMGHRQFCEQFLNPLLLRAKLGISHNAWFRGGLEGISTADLDKLLGRSQKMSIRMLAHVVMPAKAQRDAMRKSVGTTKPMSQRKGLPKASYRGLLTQLRGWISGLHPKGASASVWGSYSDDNTYDDDENRLKAAFVDQFIRSVKPDLTFDLGCNSGAFSEVALNAGSKAVVGFDFDQVALDKAYHRAKDKTLNLLSLFLDASNPSPSQGWQQSERTGFSQRATADAVLALAFEHHLAIGKNVPLEQVVEWLVSLAPQGVIEFVDKNDPTIQAMLAMREDIFQTYSQPVFEAALEQVASVVEKKQVTKDGRTMYWFKRHD